MEWTKCITHPLWATWAEGRSDQRRQFAVLGMLLVSLGLVAACGDNPPTAPSPRPPAPTPVPVTTTFVVIGSVFDPVWRPCEGCKVELADDSASTSVLTDASGRFAISVTITGPSSVTLRASKEGYKPATRTTSGLPVSFRLESLHPLDLAGTYRMTTEAGAECTELPDSARRREYVVSLEGHADRPQSTFLVRPLEGTFDAFEMVWNVSATEVAMYAARGGEGEFPGVVERVGSGERVELHVVSRPLETNGTAALRIPVSGLFCYCTLASGCTACQSQQHLVTLTR